MVLAFAVFLRDVDADYLAEIALELLWYYVLFSKHWIPVAGLYAQRWAGDPAHRILSCRDPWSWSMQRGRPRVSWLRQMESYLNDVGMTGLPRSWPATCITSIATRSAEV